MSTINTDTDAPRDVDAGVTDDDLIEIERSYELGGAFHGYKDIMRRLVAALRHERDGRADGTGRWRKEVTPFERHCNRWQVGQCFY